MAVDGSDRELKQQFQWDIVRHVPSARGMTQGLWWGMQGSVVVVMLVLVLKPEDPDELFAILGFVITQYSITRVEVGPYPTLSDHQSRLRDTGTAGF